MKYNQSYIDTFGEITLMQSLSDNKVLGRMLMSYRNQFTDNISHPEDLLLKESLDHFVVYKCNTDPKFPDTQEFKNYTVLINRIMNEITVGGYRSETITNPVFSDTIARNNVIPLLKVNYNVKEERTNTFNYLTSISKKIDEGVDLTQKELNNICEFLIVQNKFNDSSVESMKLFHYIMEKMKDNKNVSVQLPQQAFICAISSYLFDSNLLGINSGLNVRIKMGDDIRNNESVANACYVGPLNSVKMGKKLVEKCNKLTVSSSKIHRDAKSIDDIYSLLFVCFHELSHARQRDYMKRDTYNGVGLSYAINQANREAINDYSCGNHDADEIEINADEFGWHMMDMVARYELKDENIVQLAKNNSYACRIRRAFSFKRKPDGSYSKFHGIYDVEVTRENIKNHPELLQRYPQLAYAFKSDGSLNTKCFAIHEFVSNYQKAHTGTVDSEIGNELGHYIVNEYEPLKKDIESKKFTNEEMSEVIHNLFELIHADAYHLRHLSKLDVNQYKATHTNYDLDNNKRFIAPYFFFRNVYTIPRIIKLLEVIENTYPQCVHYDRNGVYKWISSYFNEMFNAVDLSFSEAQTQLQQLISSFEKSGEDYLVYLSNVMKYKLINTVSYDNDNVSYVNDDAPRKLA